MSRKVLIAAVLVALVLLAFLIDSCRERLPVYRLATPAVDAARAAGLAETVFGVRGAASDLGDRFLVEAGSRRVEVYKSSGGVWAEDTLRLWNPDSLPQLPDTAGLASPDPPLFAGRPITKREGRGAAAFAAFAPARICTSYVAKLDRRTRKRTLDRLDYQLLYRAQVANPRHGGPPFPVVGGGGELKVRIGDHGDTIGVQGVWREIEGIEERALVIRQSEAERRFKRAAQGIEIRNLKATLAYYSAPGYVRQQFLYPVYVCRGTVRVNGVDQAMRPGIVPATEFARETPARFTVPPRKPWWGILSSAVGPMIPWAHAQDGGASRTSETEPRPGSVNLETEDNNKASPEVGVSWTDYVGGQLGNARTNVQGYLDALEEAGWTVNFNWHERDAWYEDWEKDRERWVDAADLAIFVGHARPGGWFLHDSKDAGDRKELTSAKVSHMVDESTGGAYGVQDLEWIVISGCGPLQDGILDGGDASALDRWEDAFGGLHLLLGYASESYDTPDEGKLFMKYALEGETLVNAWFRAASEAQSSFIPSGDPIDGKIWVGAMWAEKDNQRSPHSDHLWGHAVAKDPRNADRVCIEWTEP
jgi:hypothetical protein